MGVNTPLSGSPVSPHVRPSVRHTISAPRRSAGPRPGQPPGSRSCVRSAGPQKVGVHWGRDTKGPQPPPDAPGPSIQQRGPVAATVRSPTPLPPRPAPILEAAAPRRGRGRRPPLLVSWADPDRGTPKDRGRSPAAPLDRPQLGAHAQREGSSG
ncbi:hypothetical protein NDU88_006581 [Pleurodeles waltl]|uniref:Uncharacterized protein n=1 Tax=Pleurodeles waltl TaxID=8319 RepID=A0AAV7NTW6_PLEWA|nr:hypothetical protein NDU88_006581 [Pleurodeles waltl]